MVPNFHLNNDFVMSSDEVHIVGTHNNRTIVAHAASYSQEGRLDVRDLRKLATLIARYPDNTVGILLLQDHDSLSKKSVQLLDTLRDKNLVTNTLNLHRDLRCKLGYNDRDNSANSLRFNFALDFKFTNIAIIMLYLAIIT
ncbi:674_t:CDS:1, partial [Ambispora leptoticha]